MLWFDLQLGRTLTNKELHSFVVVWSEKYAWERPVLWVWIPGTGQGSGGNLTLCLCFPTCQRGGLVYVFTYTSLKWLMLVCGSHCWSAGCKQHPSGLLLLCTVLAYSRHFINVCGVGTGLSVMLVQLMSHVRLCNPMDCSMPGSSVLHCLQEFVQIHVHWVSDAI